MTLDRAVAVTIPAYRAESSVGDVVAGVLRLCPRVLVVDDGSDDRTAEKARAAGAEVISHPINLGKGRALETAFTTLFPRGYEAVVTIDADGQHLPEEVPGLVASWKRGADLVMGTRAHLFAEMGILRRFGNGASSWAISRMAGTRVADVQTGFRLYSRRLISAIGFPEPRFEAESAVVVRAARAGFVIATEPIALGFADGRTTSHFRPLVDSARIASAVVRARFAVPNAWDARVGDG